MAECSSSNTNQSRVMCKADKCFNKRLDGIKMGPVYDGAKDDLPQSINLPDEETLYRINPLTRLIPDRSGNDDKSIDSGCYSNSLPVMLSVDDDHTCKRHHRWPTETQSWVNPPPNVVAFQASNAPPVPVVDIDRFDNRPANRKHSLPGSLLNRSNLVRHGPILMDKEEQPSTLNPASSDCRESTNRRSPTNVEYSVR